MNLWLSLFFIGLYIVALLLLLYLTYKNEWYKLNHENLFSQKIFWISILTPTLSFIYFGIFSWLGHKPQLDSDGMTNFLTITKLPLFILAAAVPLGAIITNLHRTYQVEAQIKTAEEKNKSDAFYAHYKYYTETFSKLEVSKKPLKNPKQRMDDVNSLTITINKTHTLYKKAFHTSSPITGPKFTPSSIFLNATEKFVDNFLESVRKMDHDILSRKLNDGISKKDEHIKRMRITLLTLCTYLCIEDDISELDFLDMEINNRKVCLKLSLLRLRLMCIKVSMAIIQILDILGVDNKSHPELYGKIKKLRTCVKEPISILDNIEWHLNAEALEGTLNKND
ncbi:TPA: hypothetical protein ACGB05_004880 [Klebsiella aerogenes]|uniref:hypothetical protein n=1 Tax=Klebsiella aerogenes TaxID=548 RepID=UPI00100F03B0|nr:hypothetical protein [Klebsiella aerogenes]RXX26004.1 hypothetical protein CWC42_18720 [Klebsiella aerogenes]RXX26377.1 hypothetical protein CWC43_20955 [Klebsiella aerogenes]HBV3606872.1 hypothetical protein [Klebsiella aerogenes]